MSFLEPTLPFLSSLKELNTKNSFHKRTYRMRKIALVSCIVKIAIIKKEKILTN